MEVRMAALYVIGIQENGWDGLSQQQQQLILKAGLIIGGQRHLDFMPVTCLARRMSWPKPFRVPTEIVMPFLQNTAPVVFLTSGDPWHFGPGPLIAKSFPDHPIQTLSALSTFSLAAAALNWPLQETDCQSIHGRAMDPVIASLSSDKNLLCLTSDATDPVVFAEKLQARICGKTRISILSNLSGPTEKKWQGCLLEVRSATGNWSDLNIIAIPKGWQQASLSHPVQIYPGMDDDMFAHDGQITKSMIRAMSLAALQPAPNLTFWDIGAGCGSVAIEWAGLSGSGPVYAIEKQSERCHYITRNLAKFNLSQRVTIKPGDILAYIKELPCPDRIFVGGSVSDKALWQPLLSRLQQGGMCVANAVTLEGEQMLGQLVQEYGGKLQRIHLERLDQIGRFHSWQPARPITQWSYQKR